MLLVLKLLRRIGANPNFPDAFNKYVNVKVFFLMRVSLYFRKNMANQKDQNDSDHSV